MGSSNTIIYDTQGKEIKNRQCILLVTPPSYEISRFVSRFPQSFPYQYISIGQMIRDEINKKTNYSKIILQNLEKHKKINEDILDILLKNAALQGNFMIKCNTDLMLDSPKDSDEIVIWKQFMKRVNVEMAVVIYDVPEQNLQNRPSYKQKLKEFDKDIRTVKDTLEKKIILEVEPQEDPITKILDRIKFSKYQKQQ